MRTTPILTAFIPLALAASGCSTTFGRTAGPDPEPPADRCGRSLDRVSSATHPEAAIEAASGYLSCVATWEAEPPPDMESRISSALAENAYPQTRRQAPSIIARFFDEGLLQKLPQTRRELAPYQDVLDAQILRAQAERNTKFVAAAEKRAKELQVLAQVLESMDERD